MEIDAQSSARDRLLEAADELFYAHGINATGVSTLVERADVAIATLYNQFGGKDDLVAAYLDERDEAWRRSWEDAIAAAGDDPSARLTAIFDALEQSWQREGRYRGCAHVDAAAELADPDHPAQVTIARHKQHLRDRLAELAAEAGAADPDETASGLLLLYEGAITALQLSLVPQPLATARRLAAAAVA